MTFDTKLDFQIFEFFFSFYRNKTECNNETAKSEHLNKASKMAVFKYRAHSKNQVEFVRRHCRTEPILAYVMPYFPQELTLQSLQDRPR